jgi:hypothetical protein
MWTNQTIFSIGDLSGTMEKEYQEYVKKTPILIPLVPLYSVEKYKWLVG